MEPVEGDLQRRLGRNLRNLRQAKGLSQEGFADTIAIHRTYMGGLERGERNVTLQDGGADRRGARGGPGDAPDRAPAEPPGRGQRPEAPSQQVERRDRRELPDPVAVARAGAAGG